MSFALRSLRTSRALRALPVARHAAVRFNSNVARDPMTGEFTSVLADIQVLRLRSSRATRLY